MRRLAVILLSMLFLLTFAGQGMAAENQLTVSPDKVNVGLNFKGAALDISGSVPDNAQVYIKVSSPNDAILDLNKKGKVSLFWMNVESTSVTKVPKLYRILSSQSLSDLPQDLQAELGIDKDYSAVYQMAEVRKHSDAGSLTLEKSEAQEFVNSMVGLFSESGLYGINESGVQINNGKFNTSFELPANIPQEKCNITVYFIKDGQVIGTSDQTFDVETIGIVKWLNDMAIYDGPFYGYMSVLIALLVGSAIAFLFIFLDNRKKPHLNTKTC
ncbi:Putative transmembrane protein (Alph_Pro_TM) [Desulfosporosinus orientis DSM 765]|uniref:Putative transmembrane protein (Alph_Pro_TM) n=1 Tax=Desulfosporosinus orientis (strain ATCC 19365 / DSM 765 / NCIMB 8382 / VKM B-1628 / Singapore I) TaxID=768706 RepID=G7WG61_DESOD|nr:TIGR02186 family protein [Desulfosporosinus orientis]AET70155.1 Putative transmembrane protein (Alph_Pro_TM) [Desulfosporosinus orientis DSM 765]